MSSRVCSVLSLKGGVGKTSITLGLASAAHARGLRALVIDLDPQANSTVVLDPQRVLFTSNDVLADGRAGVMAQAVVKSGWGETIDLVASERALEHRAIPEGDGSLRLRVTMQGLEEYDLILIDTPPALGELTRNALTASDLGLVVAEPSLFALQGAQQALDAMTVVRDANLRLHLAGIVVNRMRPTSSEHRYRMAELALAYGDLLWQPPLPDRAVLQQAAGACTPVHAWHTQAGREVARIFDQYLEQVLAVQVHPAPLRPVS
ncbi:MAG: ParA family protein [Actinomycetes bacterium]